MHSVVVVAAVVVVVAAVAAAVVVVTALVVIVLSYGVGQGCYMPKQRSEMWGAREYQSNV
jgi:hypothetical protein